MISRMLATALTAIFLLVSAAGAGAAPLYTLDFLPAGFTGVQLNNAGQVVGRAGNAAALYSGGVVTGVAPAASYGWGINNLGDVTAALNTNAANEAFTYVGGALVNIHPSVAGPNVESTGIAINDAGVVGGNNLCGWRKQPGTCAPRRRGRTHRDVRR